jgi:hypothetical protein
MVVKRALDVIFGRGRKKEIERLCCAAALRVLKENFKKWFYSCKII